MFVLMTISMGFLGHRAVTKNDTNADADTKTDTMVTRLSLYFGQVTLELIVLYCKKILILTHTPIIVSFR